MEQLRFVSASTQNPRNLGWLNKSMLNDYLVQKPMTTIIDRFKAMLRDREEKIRALGLFVDDDDDEDGVSPPRSDEIVRLYELVLSELTFNSKPIITDLTIIAGEQRQHAEGIANAICDRIIQAPLDQKLPCLYLLDSIAKNIGKEYVRYFSVLLPEVFCEVYKRVNSSLRTSMSHLFRTWSTVFPPSTLRKIDAQLKISPSSSCQSGGTSLQPSESPRPNYGIHVNPKYLDARRQFEHKTVRNEISHSSPNPSVKINGKHAGELGGFDSDNIESVPTQVGTKRISSNFRANTSFASNPEDVLLSSVRDAKSSALLGTGHVRSPASDNEFDSTSRFLKISSPSHRGFDYRPGVVDIGKEVSSELRRGHSSHDNHQEYDYLDAQGYSNRLELRGPRALIDAYGTDERDNRKPHKAGHLNINAVNNKMAVQTWKDNEEEEFKWEDMSPTLATGNLNSNMFPSSIRTSENISTILGAEPQHSVLGGNIFRKDNQPGREHMSVFNGSSHINDSVHGFMSNIHGLCSETSQLPGSCIPPGILNLPQAIERNSRVPPSVNGFPASTEVGPPVKMQKSNPVPQSALYPLQKHMWSELDSVSAGRSNADLGLNISFSSPNYLPQFSNPKAAPISSYQQHQAQHTVLRPPYQMLPHNQQNMVPPGVITTPSHVVHPPLGRGYLPPGHRPFRNNGFTNPTLMMHSSMPMLTNESLSAQLPGVALPPVPTPRPNASQIIPAHNPNMVALNPPGGGALSGLFNSLMAQGLISLTNPASVQDPVGLEFNTDLLKVRHDSAISALYADLPRQCTTCGLRFKCQEEHSSHMDWHVTRNRTSKNRKQKPSRRWFVSVDMWLSGTEALGADAVPGFLPTEIVAEKKDDEESAVPADEDQTVCALCGEPFEDFYSDETEEWMYKGAAYMNAPSGSTAGIGRFQLGPIVHTKCKSDSNVVTAEDLSTNEMGYTEDGSRIKRLRA